MSTYTIETAIASLWSLFNTDKNNRREFINVINAFTAHVKDEIKNESQTPTPTSTSTPVDPLRRETENGDGYCYMCGGIEHDGKLLHNYNCSADPKIKPEAEAEKMNDERFNALNPCPRKQPQWVNDLHAEATRARKAEKLWKSRHYTLSAFSATQDDGILARDKRISELERDNAALDSLFAEVSQLCKECGERIEELEGWLKSKTHHLIDAEAKAKMHLDIVTQVRAENDKINERISTLRGLLDYVERRDSKEFNVNAFIASIRSVLDKKYE
jgi:hypothetical protein